MIIFRYLLLFLFLHYLECSDFLYMLRTENSDYCFTNSSSAMYFTAYNDSIFEDKKGAAKTFAYPYKNWKFVSSWNYDGLPVFDQRWTDLPTESITSLDARRADAILYQPVKNYTIDKNTEKITFSIRANEFEFFLCDSTKIVNSFCYWFLLGLNNTAIFRQCDHGLTDIQNQEPMYSCLNPLDQKSFHLSERKWTHITLERRKETFFLNHIDSENGKNILECSVQTKLLHLFIRTRDTKAFYKLHNYEYIRTDSLNSLEMRDTLTLNDRKTCFSLFYTTCQVCEINIYLIKIEAKTEIRKTTQISLKERLPPAFGIWKEMKLEIVAFDNFSQTFANVALEGHLISPNVNQPFWAIGSFEECQKTDYRKSMIQTRFKSCQLVSNDDKLEWNNNDELETCQCPLDSSIACNIKETFGIQNAISKICKKSSGRQYCCKIKENGQKTGLVLANLEAEWNKNNSMVLVWTCRKLNGCSATNFQINIGKNTDVSITTNYSYACHSCGQKYFYKVSQILPSSTELKIEITAFIDEQKQTLKATEYSFPDIPVLLNSNISIVGEQNDTVRFQMDIEEEYEQKANTSKYLFILISYLKEMNIDKNFAKLQNVLNETFILRPGTQVIAEINLTKNNGKLLDYTIGIGNSSRSYILNETLNNNPLKRKPSEIVILITNEYKKKYNSKLYSRSLQNIETLKPSFDSKTKQISTGNTVYASLISFFGVCVIGLVILMFIVYKRKLRRRNSDSLLITMNELNEFEMDEHEEASDRNLASLKIGRDSKFIQQLPGTSITFKPSEKLLSNPIKLSEFEEYVKRSLKYNDLERQHELFPRGQTQSCKHGLLDFNKHKNRYENLITYDHSRVILEKIADDEYSDYINASYIDGYGVPNAYIATQGPKKETSNDFWRMIWQENVNYIIMIGSNFENGKEKIYQYWPSKAEIKFGGIIVQIQSVKEYSEFEQRTFYLTQEYETRKLEQFHFTTWPDQGIPLYPHRLRSFIEKIVTIPLASTSPVVVHCSAGVGRTGTILLIDICIRMARGEGNVDFLHILQKLRQQRPNMVDNAQQYKLAHLVVLDHSFGLRTSVPCDKLDEEIEEIVNSTDRLRDQLDYLKNCEWQDEAMNNFVEDTDNYSIPSEKNRFKDIVPERRNIELPRYPSHDLSSTYINAVRVDGIKCSEKFIVTQLPMPNTLGDFWRLIMEMKSEIIISLNEIDPDDETCCKFWPTAENPEIQPVDFITVVLKNRVRFTHYDIFSLNISAKQVINMEIKVVALKGWKSRTNIPFSCEDFFSFWQDVDSLSRNSLNTIITCFDGATACGLYVTLALVIDKMRIEKECDVCTAVRIVRQNRKQFVKDQNQLIFLYGAALIYNIKCFSYHTN